jgi:hypothetical protein
MDEQVARLNELFNVVKSTTDMRAKSQLFKMYQNCRKIADDLSRESVECKRLKRVTPKYTDLLLQLDDSVKNFENWVTFSKLLY